MKRLILLSLIIINAIFSGGCNGTLMTDDLASGDEPTLETKLRSIWIVGGLSARGITNTVSQVDMYDPVGNVWYPAVTTLPKPVSFAAVTSLNGKIFVIGGFDNTASGVVCGDVQIYDVAGDSWSTGASMINARAHINAAVSNQRIYILGGVSTANSTLWGGSNFTDEYIPALDQWTFPRKTVFSATAFADRQVLAYNDVIYGLGGRTAAATVAATANSHDGFALTGNAVTAGTTEVTFTTGTNIIKTGFSAVMYHPDNGPAKMLVIGGASALTLNTGGYIFNTATTTAAMIAVNSNFNYLNYPFSAPSTWSNIPNGLPIPLMFGAAAIYEDTLYYFGGTAYPGFNGSTGVYSYDLTAIASGGWVTTLPAMPESRGRFGHAAVTINQ